MVTGLEAKELGIARAMSNRRAAAWRAAAHVRIELLIRQGAPFTSEDVTSAIGQPPSPSQVGAVLNGFARSGLIVRDRMTTAQRVNQHAALITVWRPVVAREQGSLGL